MFAFDSGGVFDVLVDPEFETNGQLFWTYIKKVGDDSVTAVAKGRLQGDRIVDLQDVFVANNGSYGTIRLHQEKSFPGRVAGTDLTNPNFDTFVAGFLQPVGGNPGDPLALVARELDQLYSRPLSPVIPPEL